MSLVTIQHSIFNISFTRYSRNISQLKKIDIHDYIIKNLIDESCRKMVSLNTGANWKNVNNWHWVEKNCNPWAKDYFTTKFVGTKAEEGEKSVSITELSSFSGDVDLNQRKGKIITIYDVEMKLKWSGNAAEKKVTGSIHIPEYMHDTEKDEIVV